MLRYSRASDGGAIFRCVNDRHSATPSAAPVISYSFWSPFTLQFSTRSKETRYLIETHASILEHDLVAHFIGCFPGPFFVYNLKEVLPVWFAILWLALSLIYAPINVYLRAYNPEFYARHRLLSIVFVRFVIPFAFLGFGIYDTPPPAKLAAIIMAVCTKSPVSNMLYSSMNLRVMFNQHIILHSVALVVALLWIPGFCHNCSENAELTSTFNEIGYGIDWVFTYGLLGKLPDPKQYPCWMISALIIVAFGYLIPTFIVFVVEVSSRSVFLQARITEEYQESLKKFKSDAVKFGGVTCLAGLFILWFALSSVRDVAGDLSDNLLTHFTFLKAS